jgi:hypothetical protein|tara:strand:- start:53 stop:475 length:423 start_codon:yes stop_codon:yes gene_type:complete
MVAKTLLKKFKDLTNEEQKKIVEQVKDIPEFANKTIKQIKNKLKEVFSKDVSSKQRLINSMRKKLKERKPDFDPTDTFDKSTMVGRVPPKQQMTKNQAMDLDLFEVDPKDIDKSIMKNTLKKSGGGRLRSYRGYGKARRG